MIVQGLVLVPVVKRGILKLNMLPESLPTNELNVSEIVENELL